MKRVLDITFVALGLILAAPVFLVIAILIRLDSRGGVFYRQERIGMGGRRFNLWKFRTMVDNADQILEDYLSSNPESLAEWNANFKIKLDPRITVCGHVLRKFSLDELPQLWNVLRGEMSLVGPRPIVGAEINKYGDGFELYKHVRPGLTGLWQVSGRNNLDYAERLDLDEFYIRNRSLWLDISILARTVWVVLRQDGAY